MISIDEIVIDPDFAQSYIGHRKSGVWVDGVFEQTEVVVNFYGTIIAANSRDINMLPEGDRIAGLMVFYSTADNPIFITRNLDSDTGTSDELEWRSERYRVMQVYAYNDYGYVKAIATRKAGD
jgi:hypothetical protein